MPYSGPVGMPPGTVPASFTYSAGESHRLAELLKLKAQIRIRELAAYRLLSAIDEMFTGTGYRPMPLVPPALVPAVGQPRPLAAPPTLPKPTGKPTTDDGPIWNHLLHVDLPDDHAGPLKEVPAG